MGWAVLPVIPGTIALWPLQTNLKDISGNGLDLSVVSSGGVEGYTSLDNIQGFAFNPTVMLQQRGPAPFTGSSGLLLALGAGEMTVQFIAKVLVGTPNFTWFQCDPGGATLYAFWYNGTGTGVQYTDTHINTSLGSPTITDDSQGHFWTFTKTDIGGGNFSIRCYKDNVLQSGSLTTQVNVGAGNEVLHLGGWLAGPNMNPGQMASVRVLGFARSGTGVANDWLAATGQDGANAGSIIYDAVAAAQFATALRQSPRS